MDPTIDPTPTDSAPVTASSAVPDGMLATEPATAPVKVPVAAASHGTEPLAVRVAARRAELVTALERLGASELRARADIEIAIASVDTMTTGDSAHPSDAVAASLSAWLEHHRHLGLTATPAPTETPTVQATD